MTERFQKIYKFLQLNYFDPYDVTYPSKNRFLKDGTPVHYNCDQINMWSDLNVRESELKAMEKSGLVKHFWFKDHGNCYYAIV